MQESIILTFFVITFQRTTQRTRMNPKTQVRPTKALFYSERINNSQINLRFLCKYLISSVHYIVGKKNAHKQFAFRKFRLGKKPLAKCTIADCAKVCKHPNLRDQKSSNSCNTLCSRCIRNNWSRTDLPGGAFGSQADCFRNFNRVWKPSDVDCF